MHWFLIGLMWSIVFFSCVALWDVVRSREVEEEDDPHWESIVQHTTDKHKECD
ncbi:MAG TPA: hypothetical protein VMX74_11375 [Pirellulales bacterium]|nr:hypothetical protein [Pirellulales bacterium]